MIYSACLVILHLKHPVKLITCFIKNIRNSVSTLRNTEIIILNIIISVCHHEIRNCFRSGYNISSVITGIMPSAGNILCYILISVYHSVLKMALRMSSIACRVTLNSHSAALSVEHENSLFVNILIRIFTYFERIACTLCGDYIVISGFGEIREISLSHINTGSRVSNFITELTRIYGLVCR